MNVRSKTPGSTAKRPTEQPRALGSRWYWPLMVACGISQVACAAPKTVILRVNGQPEDALVTINDRYVGKLGRVSQRGIRLVPGLYRITVELTGFFPEDETVKVGEKGAKLDVTLDPIPE